MISFDWILQKSRDPHAVIAFNALRHAPETPSFWRPRHAALQASMPRQPSAEHEVNPGSPQPRSSLAQKRETSAWILCAHSQHMWARGERLFPVGRCTRPHTDQDNAHRAHTAPKPSTDTEAQAAQDSHTRCPQSTTPHNAPGKTAAGF